MSTPLRLLGITGSDTGLNGLVKRLIQKGYEPLVTRVDTIEAMQDELSARSWDIVIIDARFTHIDIFLALAVLREHLEDIPCLVISDPVTISLDSPPVSLPVFTDPSLLSHAFDEIIDNAIKFSIPGGCITVKGFRSDGWCMIRISDTGRGISAENIPELLKPFIQLHRDEKVGGLGIGIPIANGILFQLDGALSITSPGLGRGSTCTLTLPAHNHV